MFIHCAGGLGGGHGEGWKALGLGTARALSPEGALNKGFNRPRLRWAYKQFILVYPFLIGSCPQLTFEAWCLGLVCFLHGPIMLYKGFIRSYKGFTISYESL